MESIEDAQAMGDNMFKKKTTRRELIPFIRRVKVPVVTRKVVPVQLKKRIKTKRLVEVEDFEEVEVKYTEFKEVAAIRKKKTWKEKLVDEEYTEKIPVQKTR